MKKRNAFTLVELLSSLSILAFLVGTLLPMLTQNSRQTEYKAGYQRAINNLNSAYTEYLQTGKDTGSSENGTLTEKVNDPAYIGETNDGVSMTTSEAIVEQIFKKHLSTTSVEAGTFPGCVKREPKNEDEVVEDPKIFYTTDGMRYCVLYDTCAYNTNYSDNTCGEIWVDVNGKDGPNQIARSSTHPADIFPVVIMKNRFIPGSVQESQATASTYAQNLYFGVN